MLTKQTAMNYAATMLNGLAISAWFETVDNQDTCYNVFVLANGKRECVCVWLTDNGELHCEW